METRGSNRDSDVTEFVSPAGEHVCEGSSCLRCFTSCPLTETLAEQVLRAAEAGWTEREREEEKEDGLTSSVDVSHVIACGMMGNGVH